MSSHTCQTQSDLQSLYLELLYTKRVLGTIMGCFLTCFQEILIRNTHCMYSLYYGSVMGLYIVSGRQCTHRTHYKGSGIACEDLPSKEARVEEGMEHKDRSCHTVTM